MVRLGRRRKVPGKVRRKARGKRRGMRRNKFARKLNANKQDRATVIETQEYTAVPEGGNFISHVLGQYNRASNVARNYRFYRCKKVELEFIPYANLFAPGTAFPELYFQVDRTQGLGAGINAPVPTKNIMLARGVMPVKWTNVIKRSYSPSVLRTENLVQGVNPGGTLGSIQALTATPVLYKWYATQQYWAAPPGVGGQPVLPTFNPAVLQYFGACYYVDQPLAAPGATLGTIKMRVHWEFKQPLWTSDTEAPQTVETSL